MSTGTCAVSCAQLPLAVGEREHNLSLAAEAVLSLPSGIVILPELLNSGYCFRDAEESRSLAEPPDGPSVTTLTELAARSGSTLVTSLAILREDAVYNVAVVVQASGIIASYDKAHLWGRESEHFVPGSTPPVLVDTDFGKLGVMVCYDLEFPEFTRMTALAGADLIVAPVNWPLEGRPDGERPVEQVVVQAAARTSHVPIAVCDRTAAERMDEEIGSDWVGGSIIVGADGYPLTQPVLGRPGLISAELDLAATRDKALGPFNDTQADRRPELYHLG